MSTDLLPVLASEDRQFLSAFNATYNASLVDINVQVATVKATIEQLTVAENEEGAALDGLAQQLTTVTLADDLAAVQSLESIVTEQYKVFGDLVQANNVKADVVIKNFHDAKATIDEINAAIDQLKATLDQIMKELPVLPVPTVTVPASVPVASATEVLVPAEVPA